jgi:hypothetical protein
MLRAKADGNSIGESFGKTALHQACTFGANE